MKSIFNNKVSLIFIVVLFLFIMFSITIFYYTNSVSNLEKQDLNNVNSNHKSESDLSLTLSDASSSDCNILYSLNDAINKIKEILDKRESDRISIVKTKEISHSYFLATNYAQSTYNELYEIQNETKINGTCTLIAMLSIVRFIERINPELTIEYDTIGGNFFKDFLIFQELCEISMSMGNNYNSSSGTLINTKKAILNQFYQNHGYNVDVTDKYFYNNIIENLNKAYAPAALSIRNYNGTNGGHCVALLGSYTFNIEYKVYPWYNSVIGNKESANFTIYVICDGWNDSDDGEIGSNLQLLVYEDEAYFAHISEINEWMDYYEE